LHIQHGAPAPHSQPLAFQGLFGWFSHTQRSPRQTGQTSAIGLHGLVLGTLVVQHFIQSTDIKELAARGATHEMLAIIIGPSADVAPDNASGGQVFFHGERT
jgi:hypothetical protein